MKTTNPASDVETRLKAAAYVRMSTDRQVYSTANQLDCIRRYAAEHDIDIVATYEDAGRSGLTARGRPALLQLVSDVQSKHDFTQILVYDISRWGRFQDVDESAYYEHLCRSHGVNIAYCAENFVNDDSLYAAVHKVLKRAAAAEYSRELSVKVFAGQCRMIKMGFKTGGPAGYGLRRALVGEDGEIVQILAPGQWKVIQSQHVILVPGPLDEIEVVNQIFQWYAVDQIGDRRIAAVLNQQKIRSASGGPWTPDQIRHLLQNEKYIGNLVFNKASFKLRKTAVKNPPHEWVRCEGALPNIVPAELYAAAQKERARRYRRYTTSELIEILQRIYSSNRRISSTLIDADSGAPTARLIARHFGSLCKALVAAGIPTELTDDFLVSRSLNYAYRSRIVEEVMRLACEAGATSARMHAPHGVLLNDKIAVTVRVIRCCHERGNGYRRWRIARSFLVGFDFMIAATLDTSNQSITSYILLRPSDFSGKDIAFTRRTAGRFGESRTGSLQNFFCSPRHAA